jgi:hypothetical protein
MNSPTSEEELVAALKRMAQDTGIPAADPRAEQELLAAFDAACEQRRRAPARWRHALPAAAALLALASTIAWTIARSPARHPAPFTPAATATSTRMETATPLIPAAIPQDPLVVTKTVRPHRVRTRTPPPASRSPVEFVAWPGATGLPTFESGYLVRVDMPVAVVLSLGLVPQSPQARFVQTDVLVGQDRLPRAVRLVP